MGNNENDSLDRSRASRRQQRKKQPKKSDKLLNVLIAIVSILIVANLVFLFIKDDEKEVASENKTQAEKYIQGKNEHQKNDENKKEEEQTSNEIAVSINEEEDSTDEKENEKNLPTQLNTKPSSDPLVEQVVVNPGWKPTQTQQSGEHVSVYKEGHVDYEEKLLTFRNAVNLSESDVIFWSVRNNGGSDSSVAVLSSKDQSQKYRISIEWVQNEGWKPVEVEVLKQIEGAY